MDMFFTAGVLKKSYEWSKKTFVYKEPASQTATTTTTAT